MNQGFHTYFKKGLKDSKMVFKKKSNLFKFYILDFMTFLGSFLVPIAPAFYLSRVRAYRNAIKTHDIKLTSTFGASNSAKGILNAILSVIFSSVIFLATILAIALFGGVLFLVGLGIGSVITSYALYIGLLCLIPAAILIVIYCILYPLYQAPVLYLSDRRPMMGAGNVLKNSFDSMKNTGKRTLFMIDFIYLLIELLISVGILILPVVLYLVSMNNNLILNAVSVILFAILFLVLLIVLPRFRFAHGISKMHLFDSIVSLNEYDNEDEEEYFELPKEPSISTMKLKNKKSSKKKTKEETLISLFEGSVVKKSDDKIEDIEEFEEKPKKESDLVLEETKEAPKEAFEENEEENINHDDIIFKDHDDLKLEEPLKENEVVLETKDANESEVKAEEREVSKEALVQDEEPEESVTSQEVEVKDEEPEEVVGSQNTEIEEVKEEEVSNEPETKVEESEEVASLEETFVQTEKREVSEEAEAKDEETEVLEDTQVETKKTEETSEDAEAKDFNSSNENIDGNQSDEIKE